MNTRHIARHSSFTRQASYINKTLCIDRPVYSCCLSLPIFVHPPPYANPYLSIMTYVSLPLTKSSYISFFFFSSFIQRIISRITVIFGYKRYGRFRMICVNAISVFITYYFLYIICKHHSRTLHIYKYHILHHILCR